MGDVQAPRFVHGVGHGAHEQGDALPPRLLVQELLETFESLGEEALARLMPGALARADLGPVLVVRDGREVSDLGGELGVLGGALRRAMHGLARDTVASRGLDGAEHARVRHEARLVWNVTFPALR